MDTTLVLNRHNDQEFLLSDITTRHGYYNRLFKTWFYTKSQSLTDHIIYRSEGTSITYILHIVGKGAALISENKKRHEVSVTVYAKTHDMASEVFGYIVAYFPEKEPISDTEIKMSFWYNTNNGPSRVDRNIEVPVWSDVADNYAASTVDGLSVLMDDNFRPSHGGQLLLWRGEPGTGKTYALRALCQKWQNWCSFDYVIDADRFFGADSSYLMNIITESKSQEYYNDDDDEYTISDTEWRLLILEDAGELLALDARDRVGQALSRLLNLVDGLIGQGLKLLVLITTNEDLNDLHPAVSRPGRTASLIEFDKLTYQEARQWAKKRNITVDQKQHYSLADLYSEWERYDHKAVKEKESTLGFRMITNA